MRRLEGFSLVELVMVIVILGILGAFVGPVLYNAMRSYDTVQKSADIDAKVRYAMERITREMRDIRRQVTNSAYPDIPAMSASSMEFFKTDGTRVILNGVGGAVNLAYPAVNGMLLDQVQPGSFSLAFFQQNLAAASTITAAPSTITQQVSFIQVSASIVDGSHVFPVRLRVDLRNPQ